jgi:hypothetical protein
MSNKSKQTKKNKQELSTKIQFTNWLYKQYEISFLPKHFFIQLDKVYKGTYKNLNKPVPVEDLWDMWKRKMPFLLKVHDKNNRQGKNIEGVALIIYDLSILLSKYDSYLKWKEEQRLAYETLKRQQKETRIKYKNIQDIKPKSTPQKDILNINNIIDEI